MFKTGMTGLIRTLGPLPGSLLKGAKAGIACDWTRPEDFVYSYQPIMDEWYSSYVFEDVGGVPTQVGERMYQEILLIGNVYRINFTVSGRTKGTIVAEAGTNQGAVRDEDGTYTDTLVCIGNTKLSFYKTADFDGEMTVVSVENLSVTEALPLKTVGSWQGSRFVQPAAANMPFWDNGKDGSPGALRFDGINDFMQHTGDPQKLHTSAGFTAAFVVEPEITTATGLRTILDQTNGSPSNAGIQVVYDAANQQLTTRVSSGSGAWEASGSTWLSRGIPHIVDARWDEASGLDLVVDDHSVEVVGGSGSLADTVALELGRRVGGDYFSGRVSDMVVREGRVPEKDIERWRGKMRGKWGFESAPNWIAVTNKQSFYMLIGLTVTGSLDVDWGDGTSSSYSFGVSSISHDYATPGIRVIKFNVKGLYTIHTQSAFIGGTMPPLDTIRIAYISGCGFAGMPYIDLSNNILGDFYISHNSLHGIPPKVGQVTRYTIEGNNFSGTLHQITSTSLIELRCDDNKLTGYTPSVLPLTTTFIRMRRNLLPQTAVDQIIGDVHTNLSNRPSSGCQLFLEGNAAPSTAGKAKARDIRDHGWTVTHN